ncbi:hypothetical protein H4582DRAFT_2070321 [Lactarius indigo]|nr:hypothetical protein H4582DRAFT_2070321 [Lactarius indigo]
MSLNYKTRIWLFNRDCKQKYEDVMYLSALGQPILVLNSLKAASELLDRRSNIYSGRPRLIMAQEIISGSLLFALLNQPAGSSSGSLPKPQFAIITMFFVKKVYSLLLRCLRILALRRNTFNAPPASATMSMLYDYPTLESGSDKTVKEVLAFTERISMTACSRSISRRVVPLDVAHPRKVRLNIDPVFLWLSGTDLVLRFARWKYEGNRDFTRFNTLFGSLFNRVLSALSEGSERPSICASLFKGSDNHQLSRQEMAWVAGGLFGAGAETNVH